MKKFGKFILCLLPSILLIGCNSADIRQEKLTIKNEDFFSQKESIYGVYYFKESCPNCVGAKEYINAYLDKIDSGKDLPLDNIYFIDSEVKSFDKFADNYPYENYKEYVIGLKNYEDITVIGYPQLFIVAEVDNVNTIIDVYLGESAITTYIKSNW